MKEFWIYTLMRVGLFAGSFAIVFGAWFLVTGEVPVLWAMVIAFVLSGVGSLYLLHDQRSAFAAKVERRAAKAADRFEQQRSTED